MNRRQRAAKAKAKRLKLEAFEAQEAETQRQKAAYRNRDRYSEGYRSSVVAVMEGAGNQSSNGEARGASHLASHKQAAMLKLDRDVKKLSRTRPTGEVIGKSNYGTMGLKSMPVGAKKVTLPSVEFEADMAKVRAQAEALPRWKAQPMEHKDRRKVKTLKD